MAKSITIIVPTVGRKSLRATLESFAPDLHDEDVVHLAMDGRNDETWGLFMEMVDKYPGKWFYREGHQKGYWGHAVRNEILPLVTTDLVWHLDDDDIAAPGALDAMRNSKGEWTMFRMEFMEGHPAHGVICWRFKQVKHGDIGTPMSVAPPSKARFGLAYGGDFEYAQGLLEEFGEPFWDETIVALIRPNETLE